MYIFIGEAKMKIMCECCGINEAQVKDYRVNEETGEIGKYFVCINCMSLNNYWFYKLLNAKPNGKKRIIRRITGENWRKYLIKARR